MGYTHYWRRQRVLPRPQFVQAVEDCRRLCDALGIPLGGATGKGRPVFTAAQVCFNGRAAGVAGAVTAGDERGGPWESFQVRRVRRQPYPWEQDRGGWWGDFCKTNRLGYDPCVQGCLIALSHRLGRGLFRVASDGGSRDWDEARAACQRVLGYGSDWGEYELAPVPSPPAT